METTLAMSKPDVPISASGAIMQEDMMDLSSQVQEGTTSWPGDVRSENCPTVSLTSHFLALACHTGSRDDCNSPMSPSSEPQNTYQLQKTQQGLFGTFEAPFDGSAISRRFCHDGGELVDKESKGVIFEGLDFAVYDGEHPPANDKGSPTASQCSDQETCMDCIRERLNVTLEEFPPSISELSPEEFVDLCNESYPDVCKPQNDESFVIDMVDGIDDEPMVIDLTEDSWSEISANDGAQGGYLFQGISDYVIVGGSRCPVYNCQGVDYIDLTSV
ncbi:hypothetical protein HIM_09813 [Hirsutella minnesotensis 3608]|uniref:Uncharacterized protein n=1 Tax=Hirsutella minnesotensis 3608 TaxID=1043627 RepID=A0A0F7ZKW2_9HYPO|nr:hypothetical protein HIM_09813 [Hirsutella minnesotensis 3608]